VLRRTLLAMSASDRMRRVVATAPYARDVVARYVAGDSTDDAVQVTRQLLDSGLLVTLDHLGEDATDPERAAAATEACVRLAGRLGAEGLARGGAAEISVKPTAVGLRLREHGEKTATENISRICAASRAAGTTVTLDAEDHLTVEPTLRIAAQLRGDFADLGCVIQSSLRRSAADCAALAVPGSRVRLCKGAYRAPDAVSFAARHDVDRSYARCLRALMNGPGYPMLATHDPRLIEIITAHAGLSGRSPRSFEYQMLYGVRPAEQRRLAATGAQVRVYVPYGGEWYGYLIRRLAERPANLAFFLRSLASRR